MKPEIEFQTLRDELREWQARRFTLLGVASVFLTAYIGLIANKPENWSWDVASIPIFLVVIGASLLTRHFNRLIVRVSTYLEVFHNFKWQIRLKKFRSSIGPLHTNRLIAVFYGVIILSAVITFRVLCNPYESVSILVLSCLLGILAMSTLLIMAFSSFPYSEYVSAWKVAKNNEVST